MTVTYGLRSILPDVRTVGQLRTAEHNHAVHLEANCYISGCADCEAEYVADSGETLASCEHEVPFGQDCFMCALSGDVVIGCSVCDSEFAEARARLGVR